MYLARRFPVNLGDVETSLYSTSFARATLVSLLVMERFEVDMRNAQRQS